MKKRRLAMWIGLGCCSALALLTARPALHLARVAWRDPPALAGPPPGFVDDASRMNLAAVSEIVELSPDSDPQAVEAQLVALLDRARREGRTISIAGARHTMGGHTISPGGIALDMRGLRHMELNERTGILHVGAGAMWSEVIASLDPLGRSVDVMQSNNSFTVGGSISADCHGWEPGRPPIAASVAAFDLLGADGVRRLCSREENPELFGLVLGGYGLFGIVLVVDLRVVANERYLVERRTVAPEELPELFQALVADGEVAMGFGRLSVDAERFLGEAMLTVFRRDPAPDGSVPPLAEPGLEGLKRAVFRGAEGDEYGKRLRWDLEKRFGQHLRGRHFSRNQLLNEPVELYQNRSPETTDILQEYFLPAERFAGFLAEARRIIPAHGGDLLNATVRHVLPDQDAFLRYADREMVSLVLLLAQERSAQADQRMEAMTRALIDAALGAGGRYYLPYRLHATVEQFHAAYPQAQRFFELKRVYDPGELFQNQFYVMYGR